MIIPGMRNKNSNGGIMVHLDSDGSEKDMSDMDMIAEDMLSAFQSGSKEGLVEALKAFKEILSMEDQEQNEKMMR